MKNKFLLLFVMPLVGCGAKDECRKENEMSGVYKVSYVGLEGDCGTIPSKLVYMPNETFGEKCQLIAKEFLTDQCVSESDVVCVDNDTHQKTRIVLHLKQENEDVVSGLLHKETRWIATDGYVCSSIYEITYEKQ